MVTSDPPEKGQRLNTLQIASLARRNVGSKVLRSHMGQSSTLGPVQGPISPPPHPPPLPPPPKGNGRKGNLETNGAPLSNLLLLPIGQTQPEATGQGLNSCRGQPPAGGGETRTFI